MGSIKDMKKILEQVPLLDGDRVSFILYKHKSHNNGEIIRDENGNIIPQENGGLWRGVVISRKDDSNIFIFNGRILTEENFMNSTSSLTPIANYLSGD